MSRDILFKTEEFVFSYRVGGLLTHNNKILLQKPKNDHYAIIGGHVSGFETTAETLKREFEEKTEGFKTGEYINLKFNSTNATTCTPKEAIINGKTYPLLPRRRSGQNICKKKFPNYLDWKYCIEKSPNENTKRHIRGILIFSSKR